MKKFKKIALILGITLLLAVMGIVSVSAATLDDVLEESDLLTYSFPYTFDNDDEFDIHFYRVSSSDISVVNAIYFTDDFYQTYVKDKDVENFSDVVVQNELTVYNTVNNNENQKDNYPINYDFMADTALIEFYFDMQFNSFDTYISALETDNAVLNTQLEEKDISISTLEGQVTELNTTITEKDAVITEKDSTITTLEGEKTALNDEIATLEGDVDGLNTQVSALTTRNTQLNATVKSLENQMQLKINKAYAEGLTDSEGDLTTSGIISVFIVILTIGEVVALVMFFVSRAKRRKKNKR